MIVRIYRLDYSGFQDPSQWATDIDDEIRANAAAKTPFHDAWAAVLTSVRPREARRHFVHFTERMVDYLSCVRMINSHPMSAYRCVMGIREGVANIYATYSDLSAMGVDENTWPGLNVRMSRTAVLPPLPSNMEQHQCPSTCVCGVCVWRRAQRATASPVVQAKQAHDEYRCRDGGAFMHGDRPSIISQDHLMQEQRRREAINHNKLLRVLQSHGRNHPPSCCQPVVGVPVATCDDASPVVKIEPIFAVSP